MVQFTHTQLSSNQIFTHTPLTTYPLVYNHLIVLPATAVAAALCRLLVFEFRIIRAWLSLSVYKRLTTNMYTNHQNYCRIIAKNDSLYSHVYAY